LKLTDWKELFSTAALLTLKPIVIVILAVVGIILLIIPVFIIWAYQMMTGLIFGVVALLFIFVLHRIELLDTEKYPWLILTPLLAFFAGVVVEKGRVFQLVPLQATLGALSLETQVFNITFSMAAILIIASLLVIGLAKRT
jgi:hypothetical protein